MSFAIFDVETRIDKRLLRECYFPDVALADDEAFARWRSERSGRGQSDFAPLAFHVPISIAVGNAADDYTLQPVETLCNDNYSEREIVAEFWRRIGRFQGRLVSFNGRRFDLPVLELAALRYGLSAPDYFAAPHGGRERLADRHLDLYDFLTNRGAARSVGGLDALLRMIGLPGKAGLDGARVQEYYEAGRLAEIHRYCRADVVRTHLLFLRVELMRGRIDEGGWRRVSEAALALLAELEASSGQGSGMESR